MKNHQILPDDNYFLEAIVHQFLLNSNSNIVEEFQSEFRPMKVAVSLEDIVQKYEASSPKEEVGMNVSDFTNSLVYEYLSKAAPDTSKDFSKLHHIQPVPHSLEELVGYCQESNYNFNSLEKESRENNSDFTKSIVYEFLLKAAPSTSKDFSKIYSVQPVSHSLEDVVGFYQTQYWNGRHGIRSVHDHRNWFPEEIRNNFKDIEEYPGGVKFSRKEISVKTKTSAVEKETNVKGSTHSGECRRKVRRFTLEEDKIILEHLDKCPEKVDLNKLGRILGRSYGSVHQRVSKLKSNVLNKRVEKFTDLDRKIIVDMILENRIMGSKLTDQTVMTVENWKILTRQFCGRHWFNIRKHWRTPMQPWLLQHFSGTLDLQIDKMLVSCIADNFGDSGIDWDFVVKRSEFVGHTIFSLKQVWLQARRHSAEKFKIGFSDLKIDHIKEYVSEKKTRGAYKNKGNLIEYFLKRVKELGVTDFV